MSKPWKIGIGCLASLLITFLVLAIVAWKFVVPALVPQADARIVLLVATGIHEYAIKNAESVPESGDNAVWTGLLKDREIEGFAFKYFIFNGRLISSFLVPLDIQTKGIGDVSVVAAGLDRKIGTEDDIDYDRAMAMLDEWETKSDKASESSK